MISFPPVSLTHVPYRQLPLTNSQLFGHEIVAILCGLVWGLFPGFGIVAAGTFIGEVGNF